MCGKHAGERAGGRRGADRNRRSSGRCILAGRERGNVTVHVSVLRKIGRFQLNIKKKK